MCVLNTSSMHKEDEDESQSGAEQEIVTINVRPRVIIPSTDPRSSR